MYNYQSTIETLGITAVIFLIITIVIILILVISPIVIINYLKKIKNQNEEIIKLKSQEYQILEYQKNILLQLEIAIDSQQKKED